MHAFSDFVCQHRLFRKAVCVHSRHYVLQKHEWFACCKLVFAFTICFLNIFFRAMIVFRVLINWQSSFRLLCSLIFVAGFCYDCVKCCAIGWVSIFPMWKSSGRAFAAATVRCRGRGYIAFQSCKFRRKALRVTPRGKHWLTVYRAPQVLCFNFCDRFSLCFRSPNG